MDQVVMGQRIRAARKLHNMTIEGLAAQIGIAAESLGHIECGVRKTSLQTLIKIAEELEVSLDYLAGRTSSHTETVLHRLIDEQELTEKQKSILFELVKTLVPFVKQYDYIFIPMHLRV